VHKIETPYVSTRKCLKAITYVSFAELQPRLSHEPLVHDDYEEVYYIINGTGKIKIGNEEARFRDGDIIYIPENTTHSPEKLRIDFKLLGCG
jgi:mannose-6-phosphate isomerase-like protein (cupin superfamily)